MAACGHDVAAVAFHGRSDCLNLADSAWQLPIPGSASDVNVGPAVAAAAKGNGHS